MEILQIPALRSFPRRPSLRTACQLFPEMNWIAISSQPPLQNSIVHSTQLNSLNHLSSDSKSKLCYDRRSVGQYVLVSSTHLGLTTKFLILSDSCGFVDVWRSPPGARWPSYTPRHWVLLTTSLMRAAGLGSSLYSLGADPK
jgi:hypothetical protein